MVKRAFDITAAATALVVLSPVFLAVAICIRIGSPGPVIFRQKRVGLGFRPFWLYKFRTMVPDAAAQGPITWGGAADPRITRVGRILRRTKLDELPQLINILRGDMSVVGPRPEVAPYVDLFRTDYQELLRTRPGLTDLASLKFRDEAAVLARAKEPEEAYVREILPEKIRLSRQYIQSSSIWLDLSLVVMTLASVLGLRRKV
jgi:lipopolysaccharide/colanic/teichoic acid biosynthesis glycosyltransferase